MPICQDTGIAVFFLEIGEDIHFHNDLAIEKMQPLQSGIEQAINEAYAKAILMDICEIHCKRSI